MEQSECNYDLDDWKTFVLTELCKLNEASLIDTIWNRLKVKKNISVSNRKAYYLFTDVVLKCLEIEHGLIRTEKNGIQITTEGKYVASLKKGFSEYVKSIRFHKTIVKWNDYFQFATTLISFVGGTLALLNLKYDWWDKNISVIAMAIIIILTVVLYFYKKLK